MPPCQSAFPEPTATNFAPFFKTEPLESEGGAASGVACGVACGAACETAACETAACETAAKAAPGGSVLIMALFLILLMSLMAFSVAFSTSAELNISANTDNGRKAFIQADSALEMSVLISRIMLFPGAGSLSDFLPSRPENLLIEVNEADFDLALLRWNNSDNDYRRRYLKAAARTSGIDLGQGAGRGGPLMTFRRKKANGAPGPVVAASAVSLDHAESSYVGASVGQSSYREPNSGRRTVVIVTTAGRSPMTSGTDDESALLDSRNDVAHAVVTTAFQEIQ